MRRLAVLLLSLTILTGVAAAGRDQPPLVSMPEQSGGDRQGKNSSGTDNMIIKIGSATFKATLEDNPTAKVFKTILPMTIRMNELNGNEKYYNLPNTLPTTAANPGTVRSGDISISIRGKETCQ